VHLSQLPDIPNKTELLDLAQLALRDHLDSFQNAHLEVIAEQRYFWIQSFFSVPVTSCRTK
jgi:hypothetical protein